MPPCCGGLGGRFGRGPGAVRAVAGGRFGALYALETNPLKNVFAMAAFARMAILAYVTTCRYMA